jgi:hypothetical protein
MAGRGSSSQLDGVGRQCAAIGSPLLLTNMRSRFKRYSGAGDLNFITCSCYRRQPLLATPHSRNLLLKVLERVHRRYSFVEDEHSTSSGIKTGEHSVSTVGWSHFSKSARSGAPPVISLPTIHSVGGISGADVGHPNT